MKRILYILSCIFILTACIDEYNVDLGAADQNILVVEGNIISDSECRFTLSHTMGLNEYDFPYINDANIAVVGTDGSHYDGIFVGGGTYMINVGTLKQDAEYSLEVLWDGATFTSSPAPPLDAPDIEEVSVTQPRDDRKIDILITNEPNLSGKTQYFKWSYQQTWEVKAKYHAGFEYDPIDGNIVPVNEDKSRGWKSSNVNDLIIANSSKFVDDRIKDFRLLSFSNSDQRFSVLLCLDVCQYAISQAQYEYEEARLEISDGMGGIFAPQPSEVVTNISASDKSHRAIGYVGVCGKVAKYRRWIHNYEVEYNDEINRQINILDNEELLAEPYYRLYELGYQVADEYMPLNGVWQWVPKRGVDVTQFGATLKKPDFWPI